MSLFESCRTAASSAGRPSEAATDLATATARAPSDARIGASSMLGAIRTHRPPDHASAARSLS
ncbi:hypothetical protein ACW23B_16990 [Streptomyces albidoflavus]